MTQEQLESLNSLFEANQFEKVVEIANQQDEKIEADDHFAPKLALAYYHTEDYKKSTELFKEICRQSKDSVDWFNYSLSLVYNREEYKLADTLNTALRYNRERDTNGKAIPPAFMRLYAAQALVNIGDYTQAYNQLNELAGFYTEVGKTDDISLYDKGIPFFSEFVALAKNILPKQNVTDSKSWIAYISSSLDDAGKKAMSELI